MATGAMPRERFQLISKNITFDDNREEIRQEKKKWNVVDISGSDHHGRWLPLTIVM